MDITAELGGSIYTMFFDSDIKVAATWKHVIYQHPSIRRKSLNM